MHEIFFIPKHSLRLQRIGRFCIILTKFYGRQRRNQIPPPTSFQKKLSRGTWLGKKGHRLFLHNYTILNSCTRGAKLARRRPRGGGDIPFFIWDWKIRQVAQNSMSVCKCWGLPGWVRLARRWPKTGRERYKWIKGVTKVNSMRNWHKWNWSDWGRKYISYWEIQLNLHEILFIPKSNLRVQRFGALCRIKTWIIYGRQEGTFSYYAQLHLLWSLNISIIDIY